MSKASQVERRLRQFADRRAAVFLARYFKTGRGEYGEGDRFLGIKVPQQRIVAREFADLSLAETEKLLHSGWHECRAVALMILVRYYDRGDVGMKRAIYRMYLRNLRYINNWDLIDGSSGPIVGGQLHGKGLAPIFRLARSKRWNERRVAVMATLYFIKRGEFETTLQLAERLLDDEHDLIHKAAGWMLREIGNRDVAVLRRFLKKHVTRMPRTMLRYAIEKLNRDERRMWMSIERD